MRATKPTTKALLPVALLLFLFSLYSAKAFYDPGIQRWVNRDPLGEPGFETVRAGTPTPQYGPPKTYLFLENAPNGFVDSDGLSIIAIPIPVGGGALANPIGGALCGGAAIGAVLCWAFPNAMTKPGEWIGNWVCPARKLSPQKAKKQCIDECSEKALPTGSYDGAPFFKCMRECMKRNGWPNY